jgi:methionine sulfoxide reductase heme-binding subunit
MAAARIDVWLKPGVLIGGLSPLAVVGLRAWRGTLGPNPVAELLNQLGLLALIFLVASLAATPLARLWGLSFALRLRRMLGLFAFLYATLHLLCYVLLDRFGELGTLLEDLTKRPFIAVGAAAWLLLLPLAITSTGAMQKRLGGVRWRRLHRLSYVAAALGLVHFFMRVKKDLSEPASYAIVLGLLLAARLYAQAQQKRERSYS